MLQFLPSSFQVNICALIINIKKSQVNVWIYDEKRNATLQTKEMDLLECKK